MHLNARPAWLPPLWQSAAALAAAIAVGFGIDRWIANLLTSSSGADTRVWVVAARVGLAHGWSHIYDIELERATAAGLGPAGSLIDAGHIFVAPPPAAWLMVPLAPLSLQAAYAIWTLVNLAALVAACWLVCPGSRFARLTVLLVSLALWPVHYQFWLGQWVAADLVFVAAAWWLLERDRWLPAGVMLAIPFFFKPQDIALLPLALLVSGRWRPLVSFAVTAALLAAVSLATLGPAGVNAWMHSVDVARNSPLSGPLTYSSLFGRGMIATAVEAALGAGALALAWWRRDRLSLVFALALAGTTASATYLHEDDVAILVLGAWIMLSAAPSTAQKIWLGAGIVAAQFISIGQPIPMLLWEAAWIGLLGLEPVLQRLESPRASPATVPKAQALQP